MLIPIKIKHPRVCVSVFHKSPHDCMENHQDKRDTWHTIVWSVGPPSQLLLTVVLIFQCWTFLSDIVCMNRKKSGTSLRDQFSSWALIQCMALCNPLQTIIVGLRSSVHALTSEQQTMTRLHFILKYSMVELRHNPMINQPSLGA